MLSINLPLIPSPLWKSFSTNAFSNHKIPTLLLLDSSSALSNSRSSSRLFRILIRSVLEIMFNNLNNESKCFDKSCMT